MVQTDNATDDEIFAVTPRKNQTGHPRMNIPIPNNNNNYDNSNDEHHMTPQTDQVAMQPISNSDSNSERYPESESEYEAIFDDPNPDYLQKRPEMIDVHDNFAAQNDNLIIFVT
jgi:hypothetical protein